mgnify:CR=1 FL=1
MKRIIIWIVTIVLILFSVVLYGIKLSEMGIPLRSIIIFIVLFIAAAVILGCLIMIFTKGIRKKFNEELKSGRVYDEENGEE